MSRFLVILNILDEMKEIADYPFNARLQFIQDDVIKLMDDYAKYRDEWEALDLSEPEYSVSINGVAKPLTREEFLEMNVFTEDGAVSKKRKGMYKKTPAKK